MVNHAKEHYILPNLDFLLGNAEDSAFPANSLNAVFMSSVGHHLTSYGDGAPFDTSHVEKLFRKFINNSDMVIFLFLEILLFLQDHLRFFLICQLMMELNLAKQNTSPLLHYSSDLQLILEIANTQIQASPIKSHLSSRMGRVSGEGIG